jgi:hypothetical protein
VEKKQQLRPWPVKACPAPVSLPDEKQVALDLDEIWRIAVGLDLGSRSVLEAEVLMWRICNAKASSPDVTRRALNEEWESD